MKRIYALVLGIALALMPISAVMAQSQGAHVVIGNETVPGPASPNCTVGPCFVPHVGILSLGYQQFTVATSTALPSVPASAREAFVVCTGQQVNWRDDGVAPTASVGMPLAVSQAFPYTGNLAAIRFIQVTATATCNVTYYP
jgi:hypothetical protein